MNLLSIPRALPRYLTYTLTSSIALLAACGDDADRPAYTISVEGADADAEVASLEDDQLRDICAGYAAYVDAEVSFDALSGAVCLATAILSSATPESCEATYDACTANAPEPLQIRARVDSDAACTSSLQSCDATVAQLEGCIDLRLDGLLAILDRLACSGPGMRDEAANLMNNLSTCVDVGAQCTDFTQVPDLI